MEKDSSKEQASLARRKRKLRSKATVMTKLSISRVAALI